MSESKEKRNSLLVVMIVLLLLLVCVLLWLLLKPQPDPIKIPTGNVDVFDIRISCICKARVIFGTVILAGKSFALLFTCKN